MTNLGTRLLTWLRGELVGSDAYGNSYYRLKNDKPSGRGGGRFSREQFGVKQTGQRESAQPVGRAREKRAAVDALPERFLVEWKIHTHNSIAGNGFVQVQNNARNGRPRGVFRRIQSQVRRTLADVQ